MFLFLVYSAFSTLMRQACRKHTNQQLFVQRRAHVSSLEALVVDVNITVSCVPLIWPQHDMLPMVIVKGKTTKCLQSMGVSVLGTIYIWKNAYMTEELGVMGYWSFPGKNCELERPQLLVYMAINSSKNYIQSQIYSISLFVTLYKLH